MLFMVKWGKEKGQRNFFFHFLAQISWPKCQKVENPIPGCGRVAEQKVESGGCWGMPRAWKESLTQSLSWEKCRFTS